MIKFNFNKLTSTLLIVCLLLSLLAQVGCGTPDPEETPTPEPTVETTPEASTPEASTPEETPEESKPQAGEYSITYDLDGGILEGNPTTYSGETELKLIIPIRPGYDFVGWTGTGVDTPTVSLTLPAGTTGDLSFKANWTENTDFEVKVDGTSADVLVRAYFQKAKAVIVVDETVNDYNELAATKLQQFFEKNKTIIKIQNDTTVGKYDNDHDIRFYFGKSSLDPVKSFADETALSEYGVLATEDSLCFLSWDGATYEGACGIYYEILDHVMKGGSYLDFAGGRYVGRVEDHVSANIPRPDTFDSTTDVGEGAIQIYSLDSTEAEFTAYCEKLASAGFKLHTTNEMNKAKSATYYTDDTIVNVMFAGGDPEGEIGVDADRSLRIIAEPAEGTALPMLEKPEDADEKVTPVSITMLDNSPDRSGELASRDGNLCLIIQLSNGHFIIVDSNHNATTARNIPKMISDHLRDLAPDRKPIIDAWILTHFHQDHIGGFVDFNNVTSYLRYSTIKSVIYNFPNERVINTAAHSYYDMKNINDFYGEIKGDLTADGTTFYRARTGQKYYFGDAVVEILWTFEDIAPHNIFKDRTNPTCIGFSIEIAGQKLMITGDSSTEEFFVAGVRYGDYLKSDIVQLSHHGYGDGNVNHDFYKYVNAPYVINSGLGASYGAGERWAMENAEVYILREHLGTCVIPLPYKGGEFEHTMEPPAENPEETQ